MDSVACGSVPPSSKREPPSKESSSSDASASGAFWKLEVVCNGVHHGMQARYNKKGREFPVAPGKIFHYTHGRVPAMSVTATPQRSRFANQVLLELCVPLETVMGMLLKSSTVIRRSVRCHHVKGVKTNFWPVACPEDPDNVSHTNVYLSNTKNVPLSCFQLEKETDVLIFPSTLSIDKENGIIKCRVGAVPVSYPGSTSACTERDFDDNTDAGLNIPDKEVDELIDVFKSKWHSTEDEDATADGESTEQAEEEFAKSLFP